MQSPLSIYIVDDDKDNLALLHKKLGLTGLPVAVTASFTHAVQALEAILQQPPDLLITDIDMPDMDGIELVSQLRHLNLPVIFVTAYEHYAIKAIKFSAIDYLLKPVNLDELKRAVETVLQKNNMEQQSTAQRHLIDHWPPQSFDTIVINTQERAYVFRTDDIMQIEANNNYSQIYDVQGQTVLSTKRIQHYEDLLKEHGFFRSHRSYLINIKHIAQVDKEGQVLMRNGFKAIVNKELVAALIARLGRR